MRREQPSTEQCRELQGCYLTLSLTVPSWDPSWFWQSQDRAGRGRGVTTLLSLHPPLAACWGSTWEKRLVTSKEQVREACFPLLHN